MEKVILKSDNCLDSIKEYAAFCIMPSFVIDKENESQIKQLAETITNHKTGALLIGNTGSGKTTLMQMVKDIIHPQSKRMFIFKKSKDMVTLFNDYENSNGGYSIFSQFKNNNIFFDDLGTEDKGNNFGNKVEVMEIFIQDRYDLFKDKGLITHFTTNLSYHEIKNRYGERCASRLGEMCNVIILGGSSTYKDRRAYRNSFVLPGVKHCIIKKDTSPNMVQRGSLIVSLLKNKSPETYNSLMESLDKMGTGNKPEPKPVVSEPTETDYFIKRMVDRFDSFRQNKDKIVYHQDGSIVHGYLLFYGKMMNCEEYAKYKLAQYNNIKTYFSL